MMLTPEESIRCQNQIGADIIMQLDDVVSSVNTNVERFEVATDRSVRWLDRCINAHARPTDQNLFGIIQGLCEPIAFLVTKTLPSSQTQSKQK